ncbi:predicted protein [Plenodomus lingam JN3]|uniref:Predicted protein n=1 Tax=Leptosphaeria maculans (strain JN3 / isolate v23.1.3 / race Av1-4-5-6-7-8) TaxID=985895 RepID=E4ZZG7_LEPMJ|nr:predicted protein [Plenodomus lingam JN3]CBX96762.1 predicted protein [Plenodomus lingam JN3]
MPPQMRRPKRRCKIDRRIEQYMRRQSFCQRAQESLALRLNLPQDQTRYGNCTQNLRTKGVEQHDDGCPTLDCP